MRGLFRHLFLFAGQTTMKVVYARIIIAHRLRRKKKQNKTEGVYISTATAPRQIRKENEVMRQLHPDNEEGLKSKFTAVQRYNTITKNI